jgi:cytosine/adenosine deaminase-related metal-dependent hydrolase
VKILTASWVVPVAGPPLRDGRVAIDDGRIVWVGSAGDGGVPDGALENLGPGVLLPGLVNAHCHIELSWLQGRIALPKAFVPWVAELVAARAAQGAEAIALMRAAAERAIRQLELNGTAAVGDVSNALGHLDLLAGSSLQSVVFFELLGWDPARAPAILEAADARLGTVRRQPAANVEVRLAAHAPHSVSPPLFEGLRARGGPAALHLAESPAETRFLAGEDGEWSAFLRERVGEVSFTAPRLSPVRYASELGLLRPTLVAAHCVQVDATDIGVLAQTGAHVAVCPRSNRSLGVGVPPVPAMLEAGVHVCLGTDSLASSPSLELIDDAVALHREFPSIEPAAIVRMATLGGAEALGLSNLGAIAPGKRAVLAFAPSERPARDPLEFLVSGEARPARVAT